MTAFELVGWSGNAIFFSRFLYQWIASERAGRSLAPTAFWWLSLAGSACIGAYTLHRGEPVLFAGVLVNAVIYTRNIWIASSDGTTRVRPLVLLPPALVAAAILIWTDVAGARATDGTGWTSDPVWLACVLVGQGIWSSRFLVQWWFAERRARSHFPRAFWWLSLAGGSLLLAYALHLRDAVLVAGYVLGPVVQVRNLILGPERVPARPGEAPRPAPRT